MPPERSSCSERKASNLHHRIPGTEIIAGQERRWKYLSKKARARTVEDENRASGHPNMVNESCRRCCSHSFPCITLSFRASKLGLTEPR